jgi:hypothetical protein
MLPNTHIVPDGIVHIIERNGKYHSTQQSGTYILLPFVDKIKYILPTNEFTIAGYDYVCSVLEDPNISERCRIAIEYLYRVRMQIINPKEYVYFKTSTDLYHDGEMVALDSKDYIQSLIMKAIWQKLQRVPIDDILTAFSEEHNITHDPESRPILDEIEKCGIKIIDVGFLITNVLQDFEEEE